MGDVVETRMSAKKIFVICPVRNVSTEVEEAIRRYVLQLRDDGYKVHWPQYDTAQNDPVGLNICTTNREAIYEADEIHVWYDPGSTGSVFDLGMVFAFLRTMNKEIVIANKDEVLPTPHKSFQNVLLELAKAP